MAGSPEPEPEAEAEPGKTGIGNVLQQVECFLLKGLILMEYQAGSIFDKHKGSITSLLGLSDEKGGSPQEVLNTILQVRTSDSRI